MTKRELIEALQNSSVDDDTPIMGRDSAGIVQDVGSIREYVVTEEDADMSADAEDRVGQTVLRISIG